MYCNIKEKDLIGRGDEICKLIKPLVGSRRVAFHRFTSRRRVVFGTFSGPTPDVPVDEWRFATFVPSIRGAYRELWTPSDDSAKRYYLEQAYLHLYEQLSVVETERQFLALHSDPNESPKSPHAKYKQGPHVHVVTAPQPLPHSHFALNLGDLAGVLSSLDRLHTAFSTAVLMLKEQVLDVYRG
jgi:hypothetical protein